MRLHDFIQVYLGKLEADRQLSAKIMQYEKQIMELQETIDQLREQSYYSSPSWINDIVKPLAEELARRMGKKYVIYGPMGLNDRTTISLFDDEQKPVYNQDTWDITIVPGNLECGELKYETGEKTNDYLPGTLGAINGFNNVLADLPDDLDEIQQLLRHNPKILED